jgi:cytochrome P450
MQLSDLSSSAFYQNPYPFYSEIRDAGPLVELSPGFFISGRHAVVNALLDDRRTGRRYLEGVAARYGDDWVQQPVFQGISRMFILMNPPKHTRLRSLLMQAFNARQVEKLREIAETTANQLIDVFRADEEVDLVSTYALPFPIQIICRLLDVPVEHASMFGSAIGRLAQAFEINLMSEAEISAANDAIQELEHYFASVLEGRRARPGSDLISLLLSVETDGKGLTESEIISNVILLFFAGHETTSNMIGNMLVALHRHPQQLDMLKHQPALMSRAITECMRYESSVQLAARVTLEEGVDVEGVSLPRDTTIFLMLGAANRDPMRFDQPDALMIGREDADDRILSFGGGLHYCMGARLAMLELQIALTSLFRRLPNMRLTNLDELHWRRRNTLRGVEALHAIV